MSPLIRMMVWDKKVTHAGPGNAVQLSNLVTHDTSTDLTRGNTIKLNRHFVT